MTKQCYVSSSNVCLDGGTVSIVQQLLDRGSRFHDRRATFVSMEQLYVSSSNFCIDGATFMIVEYLLYRSSNFHVNGAPPPQWSAPATTEHLQPHTSTIYRTLHLSE